MKYNIGDIVEMKSANTGNGLPHDKESVEVEIIELKFNGSYNGLTSGDLVVLYNGRKTNSNTSLIIRMIKPKQHIYEIF